MCKRKDIGKRCPATPQRKNAESYRQKVKYQAKKEGLTSQEWLKTEQGVSFAQNNDPRILNPNWHEEHQASIQGMNSNHPQVTMSDNFLASTTDLSIIKANFPKRDTIRGQEELAVTPMDEYVKTVSERAKKLTSEEIAGIYTYSTSQYRSINRLLREIKPDMTEKEYREKFYRHSDDDSFKERDEERRKAIENIDSALSHRRDEAELTYRCISTKNTIEESLEEYKPNTIISFDGYTSTSHSPSIAVNFSDLMPEYGNNGTPVLDEKNKTFDFVASEYAPSNHNIMFEVQSNAGQPIAMHSQITEEREILLPRGMHFKVVESYATNNDSPYQIDQSHSGLIERKGFIGKIKDKLVVVQLVECDKDGNIVAPNTQTPYNPTPLPIISK